MAVRPESGTPSSGPRQGEGEPAQSGPEPLQRRVRVLEEELRRVYESPHWRTAQRFRKIQIELELLLNRLRHPLHWMRTVAARRIPFPLRARLVQTFGKPAYREPKNDNVAAQRFAETLVRRETAARARPHIICLPAIEWGLRIQRPQHLLARLAARGWPVLYAHLKPKPGGRSVEIDPEPVAPGVRTFRLPSAEAFQVGSDVMQVEDLRIMVRAMEELRKREHLAEAVVLCHSPFWRPLARVLNRLHGWPVVYDRMDLHGAFPTDSRLMREEDRRLVDEAQLVTASARSLANVQPAGGTPVLLLPNACEPTDWMGAEPSPELDGIPRPIVGFFGAISDWVDTDLLEELALARPGWSFVLVGSTWGGDVSRLDRLENVHLLGERPYTDLPALAACFDVGLLPFKRNALTEAANPVKVYEMLALGLEIVSTPLPELEPMKHLIREASGRDGFLRAIEESLREPASSQIREDRRIFARTNTWDSRVDVLEEALTELFPMVSIAVVTYNNLEMTRLCLESLKAFTEYPNYEVLVVDNASSDDTPRWLADAAGRWPQLRIFLNEENRGFAAANNQAFFEARGEIFCLLNNDTVVTPGWLSAMVHQLRDPAVGMVGPSSNGVANEARVDPAYAELDDLQTWAEEFSWEHDGESFSIPMLALFCAALRREVWEEAGGLDERFEVGMFEDDDFSRRLRRLGYDLRCLRSAWVHHFQQASFGALSAEEYGRIFEANRRRFLEKWRHQGRRATEAGEGAATRPTATAPVTAAAAVPPAESPPEVASSAEEAWEEIPVEAGATGGMADDGTPVYDSAAMGVSPLRTSLREVLAYKDLLRLLVGTNIKTRYKRSILGVAWTLLNPLATAIVMTVAFSALFRFSMQHYAVYVLSGLLFWTYFQQSSTQSMSSVVWGAGLLKKVYVPAMVFPLAAVGTGLVNLFLSIPPLLLIMLVLKHPFTPALLFLPVAVLLVTGFTLGLGLLMASFAVFFSDVVEMYGVILRIWFYLTPVMYPEKILPKRVLPLIKMNPMYHMVQCWREPIFNGTLPSMTSILVATSWSVGILLLGWWVFTRRSHEFALRA